MSIIPQALVDTNQTGYVHLAQVVPINEPLTVMDETENLSPEHLLVADVIENLPEDSDSIDSIDRIIHIVGSSLPTSSEYPQPLTGRVTPSPTPGVIPEATETIESLVVRFLESTDTFSTQEGMRLMSAGHQVPFSRLDTRHH